MGAPSKADVGMSARQLQRWIIGINIFLSLVLASVAYSQEMWVLTEEFKPYQYIDENGKMAGFGIELITLVFQDAGVPMKGGKIHIFPWSRTYRLLLEEKNAAAFLTVRNKKREKILKWVGPLGHREMWLYKLRKRKDITIKSLEEAKAYKIGGYKESADTNYLIELGFSRLHIVPHQKLNIRLLLGEKVDLISSLELTMIARLKSLGHAYDIVEKSILLDGRYDYYLAINPKTSDDLVHRLQTSLDKLKENGTYDQIKNKYLK